MQDPRFREPAWSPDEQELAVLIQRGYWGERCDLGLYQVSPDHVVIEQVALLTLRQFDVPPSQSNSICNVGWPTWDPDGHSLTFMAASPSSGTAIYRLDVALVRTALARTAGRPVTLALGDDRLTKLGTVGYIGYPSFAWLPPDRATALFTSAARTTSIDRLDPATGQVTTVLTLPGGNPCGLAAVPTRRQLLFRYCYYSGESFFPQQVYLFTPPSG